ncbi:HNH endonuclease [Planococcus sp. SIMBA_160]
MELTTELIEGKKEEIVNYLASNFDVLGMQERSNKYRVFDIVKKEYIDEYRQLNYFFQSSHRRGNKSVKWIDNPGAWIRIKSVDDGKRGKGFVMHIKCRVDKWTGNRDRVDEEYYKKWQLPFDKKNIHLRIAHGNELVYSVLHQEVEKFDPSASYFEEFLNHTFELYCKNVVETKENTERAKEDGVLRKKTEPKPKDTKHDRYGNQSLVGKKLYLNNKGQDDELEFQELVESLPNPPKGMKINFVTKEKRIESTNRIYRTKSRDATVAKNAVAAASYLCEIDEDHPYFKSKKSKENYVEAHHLIPIYAVDEFEKSIDIEANVISLCPSCHRKLHHAELEEITILLEKLYFERKANLKTCGIKLSLERLLRYYR